MPDSSGLYRRFGFSKAVDLRLYLLATIPTLIFVLLRFPVMSVKGYMCNPMSEKTAPGECYWHTLPWSRYQIGIYLHLWSVFPAALIAVLQFIPAIRSRQIQVHRMLGYICWTLGLTAGVTALMICDRSFGGALSTRVAAYLLASVCFVGHYKAIKAVRSYQLDKHREWMLRTWFYMGGILTMRPIVGLSALLITVLAKRGVQLQAILPCPQVFYMLANGQNVGSSNIKPDFFTTYGFGCSPALSMMGSPSTVLIERNTSPLIGYESILANASVPVVGDLSSSRIDSIAAALDIGFGPAFLIGIFINAVIIEWYILRTPAVAQRLQKQGLLRRKLAEQKKAARSITTECRTDE